MADFEEATKYEIDGNDDFPVPSALQQEIQWIAANHMLRKICKEEGDVQIQHMLFSGNAGVGKTQAARKMAKQMKKLGLLPTDHLTELYADSLVGE